MDHNPDTKTQGHDTVLPDADLYQELSAMDEAPDYEYILKVLEAMQKNLAACTRICDEEISYTKNSQANSSGKTLPLFFTARITPFLERVRHLLYAFEEHERLDPDMVWNYIWENRLANHDGAGIQYQENKIVIRLPHLDRRGRGRVSKANSALSALIHRDIRRFPLWHCWHATFFHVYPRRTRKVPRDVDNYDYKLTIDLLAFALGSSDNAFHFTMAMQTIFTNELSPGLYIEITPKSFENQVLPRWQNQE